MAVDQVATLLVEFRGSFAKFSADMGQLSRSFDKLGQKTRSMGKLLTAAFTAPLAGAAAAAMLAAKEMDTAFDTIRGQTGATGDELESLNASFTKVFTNSVQGAEEVGKTIAQLANGLGVTGEPLEKLSQQLTNLSQITGQDLGTNVKGTISLFNAWGVSTEKQADTLEFLFKVGQKTNQNVGELASTVASFQPTLSRLGMGVRESAAMFAQLQKNGLDASTVMGALGIVVKKFADANIKDMGPALKTIIQGIKEMPDATKAAAVGLEVFGKKGAEIASLIRSGKLSVDDFVNSIDNSDESIAKAAAATRGFSDKLIIFRNAATAALAPIGTPILDTLAAAMEQAQPKMMALAKSFAGLSEGAKEATIAFAALTFGIGPLTVAFGFLFGWIGKLIPAIYAGGAAAGTLAGALGLLLTPIGLAIAGVGALIVVWYRWEEVGEFIDGQVDEIVASFGFLWDAVKRTTIGAAESAMSFGKSLAETFVEMKEKVFTTLKQLGEGIQEAFIGKFNAAKEAVQGFANSIYSIFVDLKSRTLDHSPVPDLVEGVGKEFDKLPDKMIPPTQAAASGVHKTFTGLLNAIKDTSKKGGDEGKKLTDAWQKTSQDLKSVMSDLNQEIDPLRQNITELLKNRDFAGLTKLAESFKGNKDALDQFRSSLKDSSRDLDEYENNQKQLKETLDQTRDALFELSTGEKYISPLTKQITDLMIAGDMDGIKNLGESMQNTTEDAREFDQALSSSLDTMRDIKDATGNLSNSMGGMFEALGLGSKESSMISEILGGMATGQGSGTGAMLGNWLNEQMGTNLQSMLGSLLGEDGALGSNATTSQMMNEISGYIGVATQALSSIDKLSGDRKDAFEGGGALAGNALGAYFGGAVGAEIGGTIGGALGKVLGNTFGQNAGDDARQMFGSYIEDALRGRNVSFRDQQGQSQRFSGNFVMGDDSRFDTAGWEQAAMDQFGEDSSRAFDAVGKGLTRLLGITEDIGGQIGVILQENLSGNIDNARILMAELGVTQQQMEAEFQKAGETGQMSWHAVEVALQGVGAAFGEGLVAVGDIAGSFQQIVNSGGDGMDAIRGIQNAAIEAGQAGVQSFEAWRESLIAAGQDPAYVDAFFTALNQRGLTSLDQIREASTRVLGGVIADMQSSSTSLADVWMKAQQEADKYIETIAKIPDESTKNITLNVKANVDDASKQILGAGTSFSSSASVTPFAKGGIVTRPTLGLVGEAGAEAIMPLSALPKMLRSMGDSFGSNQSSGLNLTINAQGAAPGVGEEIRRVMKDMTPDMIRQSVDTMIDIHRRGGI